MDSLLTLWSANTAVSATVWLLLAMTLLYFGRRPAHNMLRSTGEGLRNVLRNVPDNVLRNICATCGAASRATSCAMSRAKST